MEIPINAGILYEVLVQQIFQDIVASDRTLKVEHNLTLRGKTGSHQIDVYWEFKSAGVVYKTIVQAKNWNKRVNKENYSSSSLCWMTFPAIVIWARRRSKRCGKSFRSTWRFRKSRT